LKTLVDEFMFKEGVQDQLDKLDAELVGLIPVKKRVKEIAALLVLDKMRRKLGFETAVPSLHMSFTGAPGTGKTTLLSAWDKFLPRWDTLVVDTLFLLHAMILSEIRRSHCSKD
jgi:hypothetical protein